MKDHIAIKIALIYFTLGFLWILFSDKLLSTFTSSVSIITNLQTYKGWFFVSFTAILLFLLIRREIKRKSLIEQDLIKAKEKAEESSRLKSAFLANMSHEIRTPLNGIMGFHELLSDDSFSGEDKLIFAEHMAKNGNDLLKLINDIVDISQIQENQYPVKKLTFNIHKLLQSIYNEFQNSEIRMSRSNVCFNLITHEKITFKISSDPEIIKKIFMHLLNNAFFFTNKGAVSFGYRKQDDLIVFFVEDSGAGINKSDEELIFNTFFKGKNHVIGNKGLGLGLAICKGLVLLLDGDLKFESKTNSGSRFHFSIQSKYNTSFKT